jgi:flap endonuclease-1
MEEARMYAQMTSRLKDYMADDAKRLLKLLGVPWVQAPSEGEAQAAHMTMKGDTDYCASQDYDSLLFGAPKLIRNVTISGRRKLPRKNVYVEVVPETVELGKVLSDLGITREQLVDIGILVGTDFNPEGVKGIGPKTALQLIREHGTIEKVVPQLKEASFPVEPQRIRDIFLHPKVRDDYPLVWREPNVDGVVEFMCGERDFDEERVRKALEKMSTGIKKSRGTTTLEQWFGKAQ